jgi:hypothetical protein
MYDRYRPEYSTPFPDDILERVDEVAERQNRNSFPELAEQFGIAEGPHVVPGKGAYKAFEILTLKPEDDYDNSHARIYHLPMSLSIDPNMTMRMLRLFEADPSSQLVLTGNPSSAGHRFGKLRFQDMQQVWDGDLTPAVDPLLGYLRRSGVETTDELGFSYGADKAATSAARAEAHDIAVERGVWVESAAAFNRGAGLRGLARLGIDFMSSGDKLEEYVELCDSPPLNEARELSDVGMPRYLLGLARASNIAIANSLAHAGFERRVRLALTAQPALRATLAWGTKSELTDDGVMSRLQRNTRQDFGHERVKSFSVNGMHHAGGDDIDLHAAIMLQGLELASTA